MARLHDRGLPSGHRDGASVTGRITIVQEARFRLVDDAGIGYLFTLGRFSRAGPRQLERWRDEGVRVRVGYGGQPDMGAVAHRVRPGD